MRVYQKCRSLGLEDGFDMRNRSFYCICFYSFVCTKVFGNIRSEQRGGTSNKWIKNENEYYLQKLQEEERVKEIYHDLKNYFLLSDDDKVSEEIRKKLKMYERFYETGNDFWI